jgi:hypothetical protein
MAVLKVGTKVRSMAVPDYQSLMLPVLKQAALGETRVPDVADKVADELGLTAGERDQLLPSGRQKILHNRIHWAKLYMAKAGLIDLASPSARAFLGRDSFFLIGGFAGIFTANESADRAHRQHKKLERAQEKLAKTPALKGAKP